MAKYKVPVLSKFGWQPSVLDKDLSTPPGSPSKGDRYIVGSSGTGDWAGHDGDIAEYNGASWDFTAKKKGLFVYVEDENELYYYISSWAIFTGGGGTDYNVFFDDFDDSSLFWAWRTNQTDANRTITELGSVLTIAVAVGTRADWWSSSNTAPKVITGLRGFPCEVICKINSFTINDDTFCGLFLAYDAVGYASNYAIMYGRGRDDSNGRNGYGIDKTGTNVNWNTVTTLPVWLRARITAFEKGSRGGRIIFSYSTDGSSWTDQLTYDLYDYQINYCGLVAKAWGANNGISAPFEFFKVNEVLGP